MCHKTVDNYFHAIEFVPECCKTQKINDQAIDICPSKIKYVHIRLKTCVIKPLIEILLQ